MLQFEALGVEVHIIAILIGAFSYMVFGMLWYGPLFGDLWLKLVGLKKENVEMKNSDYLFATLIALLTTAGLNSIFQFAMIVSELELLQNIFLTPVMITGTVIAPLLLNEKVWEGRNVKLLLLNGSHQFISSVIICVILGLFVY